MFTFDNSDPRYLIVYTGEDEAEPSDYHAMFAQWGARLDEGGRFGVLLVYQQEELPGRDHDEADEEHKKEEAEVMHAFLSFGRENKERVIKHTVGAAQAIPAAWAEQDPEGWERAKEGYSRLIQYNYGITGASFLSVDEAKSWLNEQLKLEVSG